MKKLIFTEFNTVSLDGRYEIKTKKFFSILDKYIEEKNYRVSWTEDQSIYVTYGDYGEFEVSISDKQKEDGLNDPNIKHLYMLSQVEKKGELDNYTNETINSVMDIETKKFYLNILKKRKTTIGEYLHNYFADLQNAFLYAKDEFDDLIFASMLFATPVGFFLGLVFYAATDHLLWMLLSFSGLGLAVPEILILTIFFHIENRIDRFSDTNKKRKTRKMRMQSLKKELSINNTLCIEDKQIEEKEEEIEIKKSIPSLINALIESLEEVSVANRGTLGEEIKQLLVDYMGRIDDATKSDIEICTEYPDTLTRINELERRIKIAKKLDTSRKKESKYLLEKLEKMESPQEVMEKPKVKELQM